MQTRQRVSTGSTRRAEWEPREPRRSDRPSACEPFVYFVGRAASFLPASDDYSCQGSLRAPCVEHTLTPLRPVEQVCTSHGACTRPDRVFWQALLTWMSTNHSCPKGNFDHSRMRHQQVWNSRYRGHTVANFLAWGFGGEHLKQCQTRSRDAEGCRVHRTVSNTHSHMAACVRASTDFRRDSSTTGSAFGIGVVSHHLFSMYMRRPAGRKKTHRGRTLKTSDSEGQAHLSSIFERVVSCLG